MLYHLVDRGASVTSAHLYGPLDVEPVVSVRRLT